ncbi:MAG: prolyl oligopeptidase family serine peptidase [Flavobacteriales bacterium]|nr:prolyl oligopeptidase family serine peptidase [Flavobacteriales bacterium]
MGPVARARACSQQHGLNAAADAYDLTVVYPNSTTIGGDLQWNVYADDQPGHGGVGDLGATDDVQFISELIDWFCDAHAIDATRVYVTGHSNGGFMVYQLALHLADRIAAFAPVAGSLWGDNTYLMTAFGAGFVPVPLFHVHGDPDPVVEYPDADHDPSTWNWPLSSFGSATCGVDAYLPYPISPTVDQLVFCDGSVGEPVNLIRIQGVGHAWPNDPGFNTAMSIVGFCSVRQLAGAACATSVPEAEDPAGPAGAPGAGARCAHLPSSTGRRRPAHRARPHRPRAAAGALLRGDRAAAARPARRAVRAAGARREQARAAHPLHRGLTYAPMRRCTKALTFS